MDILSLNARPSVGRACLRNQLRHNQCQACQDACPLAAIDVAGETAVIDADNCIGCARCLFVCPVSALDNLSPPQRTYRDGVLIAPFSLIPPTPEELLLWHVEYRIRSVGMIPDEHPGWLVTLAELNLRLARLGEPLWTIAPPQQHNVNSGRRRWLHLRQVTADRAAVSLAATPLRSTHSVTLDTSRCHLCGACTRICPLQAITLTDDCLTLDPQRCNGCKACENVCFPHAIAVQSSTAAVASRHAVFQATCSSCRQEFASWREDAGMCHICQHHTHGMREA